MDGMLFWVTKVTKDTNGEGEAEREWPRRRGGERGEMRSQSPILELLEMLSAAPARPHKQRMERANEQNGNVESESVASTSTSNRRNNLQFIVAAPSHLCILGQNMKC